jgi:hypothetical protein
MECNDDSNVEYYAHCVYGRCPYVLKGLILFVEFCIVVV